ncbi:MAG TPA: aspartate transaminase, partial [Gammaproteobacteria bacterium]|nr:aspartate transaminase [Gammaproteobacteria bacterium]
MTGWRIGYAGGPAEIIKAMKKVQGQSTSNPCSVSQAAAVAALNGPQDCIAEMNVSFKDRHDKVLARLNDMDGISCLPADGTFYLFPNVEGLMKKLGFESDVEFAADLLEKGEVALVPGSAFGLNGHLRLSFATSQAALDKALDKLQKFIDAQA